MVKNQMRENLRKHILELGIIEKGVDRIVEQVVQPKVLPIFHPAVENAIYDFLGIEKPKVENGPKALNNVVTSTSPSKKAFRPMPVSVPSREQEDATPPPGEEFGLEAITPSPDSRIGSAINKDLADEVSDVSMEDCRPTQEGDLVRICSPISMQSNSNMDESDSRPTSRIASALSAISSGDDLPSASPIGPSPVTPGDDNTMPPGEENNRSDSESEESAQEEDEDEDSDFSSPEFEKLELTQPTSRTATPNPTDEKLDEEESKKELDDHGKWRPKHDHNGPNRKPDEDPGQSGAGTSSSSHSFQQSSASGHALSSTEPKTETSNSKSMAPSSEVTDEIIDAPEAAVRSEVVAQVEVKSDNASESEKKPSSKERSRSRERKSESHKSDKKDKSHKDRHKDRHRDRSRDRDRDRKKDHKSSDRHGKSSSSRSEKEREDRHRSSKKDKDRGRDRNRDRSKERHRDRDRDRDRHRSKSESDRAKSHKEKDRRSEKTETRDRSPPHPMAHLWKRPTEKPRELAEWLARFPSRVFDEAYDGVDGLTDVSVSPVSSYPPSDAESVIYLSDVEVDTELEELFVSTGGKIVYKEEESVKESIEEPVKQVSVPSEAIEHARDWDYMPVTEEIVRSENVDQQCNSKRIRKVNSRYSDSYVGSEFRKVIHMQQHHTPEQSQRVSRPSSGGRTQQALRDYQHGVTGEPSPEEHDEREESEYAPSEPKRIKTEQPLPSSPESVQSDPSLGQTNPPASPRAELQSPNEDDVRKEAASPVNRRRSS